MSFRIIYVDIFESLMMPAFGQTHSSAQEKVRACTPKLDSSWLSEVCIF